MTIAKDFASKLVVAFVAAAMIVTAFAPAAQAQTTEDLQQMINDLLAQVAALQSSTEQGATGVASGVCPYTWTRDLAQGAKGADVMKLQQFLNADLDTRVSVSGPGSVGAETEFYGPATAGAVSKFQVKYRSEILSPNNLVNPTGYYGPSSRSKANALCTSAPVVVVDTDDEDVDEDEDEDEDFELQGEASLDNFEIDDGESSIEEGDEDVSIGEITIEFTDGDAEISRMDIALVGTGSAEPWDAFDTISLWVDGDKVAEVDASDEDEYLDEDDGSLRFTGLDLIGMEDEELEITVAASVQNNVDSDEQVTWTLTAESLRFFDADGVATTENGSPVTDDEAEFDLEEAGTDEELKISLASSNPDSTDIIVDTNSDTNDVTIMVADLEAEDNDIELNRIIVRVDTTGASTTDVIDDIRIVIDGEEISAESIGTTEGTIAASGKSQYVDNDGSDDSVWYLFDVDGGVTIDEDDEVEMEVVVDFNDTDDGARYANGTMIMASITSTEKAAWQVEGADDLSVGQIKGTANGDDHTLVAEGIIVPVDGFSSSVSTLGQNDTIGEFELEFEVTAIEGNFYVYNDATTTASTPTRGVAFTVTGGTATVTASLDSTADEDTADVFTIDEGETETFTLTVTVDPTAAGTFRVGLTEVHYTEDTDGETSTIQYDVTPLSDFRTSQKAINN